MLISVLNLLSMLVLMASMFISPLFASLTLSVFSVILLITFKSSMLSLNLYVMLIIFTSGVLLLLFYISVISTKVKTPLNMLIFMAFLWNNKFWSVLNLKESISSSSMEMSSEKMAIMIMFSLLALLLIFKILSNILCSSMFARQMF